MYYTTSLYTFIKNIYEVYKNIFELSIEKQVLRLTLNRANLKLMWR